MGREVKRVPLDFDWPMKQTWGGYLMPDELSEARCPDCRNGGTAAYDWLQKVAYVIAGLADDGQREQELGRDMHPWLVPLRQISYGYDTPRPSAQFAEFADGLAPNVQGDRIMGRDVYGMQRALIAAAGLPERWGICPTCDGYGSVEHYRGQRAEAEAWESTEPPTGDGWQMWETTSEGSPMSPVFATADELAQWLADSGASLFGSATAPKAQWLAIITGEDFAHVEIAPGVVMM